MKTRGLQALLLMLLICVFPTVVKSQQPAGVNWITFEELDTVLAQKPKPVFIDFYTDWCTYCKKMDRVVFTAKEVVDVLNQKYYAVRFDAESTDTIFFDGTVFRNSELGKKRNAIHDIARLLALRRGQFTPPVMILLDQDFKVTHRYFEYMSKHQLLEVLRD